jgi:hypothetical protein
VGTGFSDKVMRQKPFARLMPTADTSISIETI